MSDLATRSDVERVGDHIIRVFAALVALTNVVNVVLFLVLLSRLH